MAHTQSEPMSATNTPALSALREGRPVRKSHDSPLQPCTKIASSRIASTSMAMLVAARHSVRKALFARSRVEAERTAAISRTPRGIGAGCTARSW